jgi:hypothetical protein
LTSLAGAAPAAAKAVVDVHRSGAGYVVHASATVTADARTAFETLTDYERLREFVPDVESSRVVSRRGNHLVVEHVGAFHLLFLSTPVRVRLAVEHEPFQRVNARSEPGRIGDEEPTVHDFSGRYVLTPVGQPAGAVRLDYDASFQLAHGLPEFINTVFGEVMVARGMRRHFEAMLNEIERRQAERGPAAGKR